MCNYYRRFIKDYAKIADPLFKLLSKDQKWIWSKSCKNAFEEMKRNLTSFSILRQSNLEKPFILHTDASGFAFGVILAQMDKDIKNT